MNASILLLPLAAGALAACSPGARPAASANHNARIIDAIKTDEVHWNADWRSGDPAKVAAHYAPNAVVMVPGLAAMAGGPSILRGLSEAFEQPGFGMTFASDKIEVAQSGDLAAARGSYRMTTSDPKSKAPIVTTGSYVTVYKPQSGGAWKAIWDINTPGPVAPSVGLAQN